MRQESSKICLANLQKRPDITVGLNWIATSSRGISPVANGDDAVLLGVGFNLPVYRNRIRSAIQEARSDNAAASYRLDSLKDQISEEVFSLIAKAEGTRETLTLLVQDIIPKSQRSLDLSIEEYATGKTSYNQLIENWRSVLRYRLAESRLTSEFNQTLSSLSRAVGELAGFGTQQTAPARPATEGLEGTANDVQDPAAAGPLQ